MVVLAKLMPILGQAIFDAAVAWLKDPANRDDIDSATKFVREQVAEVLPSLVDKATNVIPGQLDDQVLDSLARRLAPIIAGHLPDLGALTTVVAQLQQFVGRLPNLGGLFGGGR
ncbi:hypothetical protein BTO20_06160 [Mycobacterium dioxanotrophicus]|uniref:Uncharacterized protein n=1 Tax=Mycobacterium dioxanotrophicus TaxID=482462 RepID=A0A1Y0BZ99_9MYCO|nr:hypothetical protein BTO20_06160 [Mycobacterium dioxanotrophicus]